MIHLPHSCCGRTAVRFPANSFPCVVWNWRLINCFALTLLLTPYLSSKEFLRGFSQFISFNGFATLMGPNNLLLFWWKLVTQIAGSTRDKGETAVCGCHCPSDTAVRMREVLARPWVGVCVPLALSLHCFQCNRIKFNLFFINYCIS